MQIKTKLLLVVSIVLLSASSATADEPLATIQSLASKDILAVAYVDVDSVNLDDCVVWAASQGIIDAEVAEEMKAMAGVFQGLLRQASRAGADHVIAMLHQEDLLFRGPPLLVFSVAEGHNAEKTFKSLRRILAMLQLPDFQLEQWKGSILGGTAAQIARAKAEPSLDRPRLAKAWEKFGGHDAGLMVVGSRDSRRVIKEMFPRMESPFENLTGSMIADDVDCIGVSIDLPADVDAKVAIKTTNEDIAETVKTTLSELKKLLTAKDGEYADLVPPVVFAAVSQVKPEVVSSDVVVDLKPILDDKVKLLEVFEPIRIGSRENQRSNNLRQCMLAMLNSESAYKVLPARANFDEGGNPLLSWRVHLLPFLEQGALYEQFKLDEPWDSEHNIKLVAQMPAIFADPSIKSAELNKAGKTRIVVPHAEGTIFHGKEGTEFGSITDGTSNTIAIVSVISENAVIWTKPADWEVDFENPKKGLFSKDVDDAIIAYADGSAHTLESNMKDKTLKALLTKAGGEVQ